MQIFPENIQRIERGEIIDSGYEGFFRVRADGKDEISSLPRHVALRVSEALKGCEIFRSIFLFAFLHLGSIDLRKGKLNRHIISFASCCSKENFYQFVKLQSGRSFLTFLTEKSVSFTCNTNLSNFNI